MFPVEYALHYRRASNDVKHLGSGGKPTTLNNAHFGGNHALLLMVAMYVMALLGGLMLLRYLTRIHLGPTPLADHLAKQWG
jgi:hypothetical protein